MVCPIATRDKPNNPTAISLPLPSSSSLAVGSGIASFQLQLTLAAVESDYITVTTLFQISNKTHSMATTTTTTQRPLLSVPLPLAKLFSYFPLKTYPPSTPTRYPIVNPLLWVCPPPSFALGNEGVLSADIECLKWQAHIALRGLHDVTVRWDVSQEGALNGRLPNLQIPSERTDNPEGVLLAAEDIPTWMHGKVGALNDLEGYKDVQSRDESHAWIALLEGDVHAALVSLFQSHSRRIVHRRLGLL